MKCVYAKYHDDRPPCCTHECDGCLWCDEVEAEEIEDSGTNHLCNDGICKQHVLKWLKEEAGEM